MLNVLKFLLFFAFTCNHLFCFTMNQDQFEQEDPWTVFDHARGKVLYSTNFEEVIKDLQIIHQETISIDDNHLNIAFCQNDNRYLLFLQFNSNLIYHYLFSNEQREYFFRILSTRINWNNEIDLLKEQSKGINIYTLAEICMINDLDFSEMTTLKSSLAAIVSIMVWLCFTKLWS